MLVNYCYLCKDGTTGNLSIPIDGAKMYWEAVPKSSLYVQQFGRAVRTNKPKVVFINVDHHGLSIDVNRIMSNPIFVDNLTITGVDAILDDGTMLEHKLFNKHVSDQRRYYPVFAKPKKPNWCEMDKHKSSKKQRRSL